MSEKPYSLTHATLVPNLVIDGLMPRLRDTEFRLLLVVLRQTWGWHKERDWLTHGQLKRRTGRSSAALSKAISVLVRANLILVRNRSGRILETAAERRREQASLYFSLHPILIVDVFRRQVREAQSSYSETNKNKRQFDRRKQPPVAPAKNHPPGRLSTSHVDKTAAQSIMETRIRKGRCRKIDGSETSRATDVGNGGAKGAGGSG